MTFQSKWLHFFSWLLPPANLCYNDRADGFRNYLLCSLPVQRLTAGRVFLFLETLCKAIFTCCIFAGKYFALLSKNGIITPFLNVFCRRWQNIEFAHRLRAQLVQLIRLAASCKIQTRKEEEKAKRTNKISFLLCYFPLEEQERLFYY